MQARDGGTLSLTLGNLNNAGGVIQALAGSRVRISGAMVSGGFLSSNDGGAVYIEGGKLADVTLDGLVVVRDNALLTLKGVVANQGTVLALSV